jgi:glycosyltransferase involved in cell wall biosynthesis
VRVGFDVTPLCVTHSGVGTYTANLLSGLQALGEEVVPLSHRPPRYGVGQTGAEGRDQPRGRLNKTLWMQFVLPFRLNRLGLDLGHFTNSVAPVASPCPTVITIHDMTLWLCPQHHYGRRVLSMRPLIPLAARRAGAIIAVSEATKQDIIRILGVPAAKIQVVHEAPDSSFRPLDRATARARLRPEWQVPEAFLLYVGTIEPRKNLVRLLQAFARLRAHERMAERLVIVGPTGWKTKPVLRAVEELGLEKEVRFLGYVPQEALVALYSLATALVLPSLYEGFGLPVVEAMACGAPVVASHAGALPEVGGDAVQYVEPTDVESLAAGLRAVVGDPARREELRLQGLAQAARYSWETAARQTQALYRRVLSAHAD